MPVRRKYLKLPFRHSAFAAAVRLKGSAIPFKKAVNVFVGHNGGNGVLENKILLFAVHHKNGKIVVCQHPSVKLESVCQKYRHGFPAYNNAVE